MKRALPALALSLIVCIAAMAWGIWCGGDLTKFFGISVTSLSGAIALVAASSLLFSRLAGRISLPIIVVFALVSGVILGAGAASAAFNECIDRGDLVRQYLDEFDAEHGYYPEDLSEIKRELPGERLLRGNILNYSRTKTGYDLWFRDFLITHKADEDTDFQGYK